MTPGGTVTPTLTPAQILAHLNALGTSGALFDASVFALKDPSAPTKIGKFSAASITAGQTRTYTLPDATGTVPLLGLAQTWSATQTFAGIDATSIGGTTRGTGLFTTLGANGVVSATSGTAATNTTSGAVVVTGGVGISGAAYIGGLLNVAGASTLAAVAATTISASGQITSTVATGTAPLVIASTTAVANLNASLLLGSTWAAPGTIGSGTPSTGAFTTLSSSGLSTLSSASITTTLGVTGAATLSSTLAVTGVSTLGPGSGGAASANILTLQNNTGGTCLRLSTNTGTIYNWIVASEFTNGNEFEITPSDSTGGTAFGTPALRIAGAAGGTLTIARPTAITSSTASSSTTTGALTVAGGLGVAGAINAASIKFANTGSALSVYDEGTWTPTLIGASTAGSQTYVANGQIGRYTRIGNKVICEFQVEISAKDAAMAGALKIGGLPFTVKNVTGYQPGMGAGLYQGITFGAGRTQLVGYGDKNATTIGLYCAGSGVNVSGLTAADIAASTAIVGSICFEI